MADTVRGRNMNSTDGRNPHATLPAVKADADGTCSTKPTTDGNDGEPKSDSVMGNQNKKSDNASRF